MKKLLYILVLLSCVALFAADGDPVLKGGAGSGASGLSDGGAFIQLTTATDALGFGCTSELAKLCVTGNDAAQDLLFVKAPGSLTGDYVDIRTATDANIFKIDSAGLITAGSGSTPFNLTGFTDDVAPGAPGTADQFAAYVDRSGTFWEIHRNGAGSPDVYIPSASFSGDGTVTTAGVMAVVDDLHNHTTTSISGLDAGVDFTAGILPVARGGTNNAFFQVSGPTTSTKTYTFPNASSVVLTDNSVVTVAQGGSGDVTFTVGGGLYGNGTSAFVVLGVASNGQIAIGDGAGAPVLANITAEAGGEVTVTNGAGSIELDIGANTLDTGEIDETAAFVFSALGNTTWGASVIDAGGATSLEIPNGAAPTVDAVGELAEDTTDGQLVSGASGYAVAQPLKSACMVVESLAAADDDFPMPIRAGQTIELVSAFGHCQGTCTTEADISFEYVEVGSAGPTVTAVTGTVTTEDYITGDTATTLSVNTTVTALDVLRFNVDNAVSPETDTYTICVNYRLGRT